ncbi:MAG TPA: LiaF domain-containing protein, partial [Solirubrobacteraceae bacterium]|nr:LiaF domain-containing protein [Solirubrobacteraceae bacterium]
TPGEPPAAAGEPVATTGRTRALTILGVVVLVLVGGPIVFGLTFAAAGLLLPFAILILLGLAIAWLVTGRRPAGSEPGQVARLTLLGLGVLGLLFVLAVASFWGAAAGGDALIAGLVIAAGVALVASAFARPARWLVLPALALAIPAMFVAAAGIDLDGGIGEKRYRPDAAAEIRDRYELGVGSLTVDLRDVELPAGERHVELEVGMGEAVLLVPDDVCVSTTAELGMGGVHVFDRDGGGIDVDWEDMESAPAGTPRLVVDADVGLGVVEVGETEHRHGRWRDWDGGGANEACVA